MIKKDNIIQKFYEKNRCGRVEFEKIFFLPFFKMRLYLAPYTQDELISDAYPVIECPEQGGLRFEGRYIEVEGGDDETKVMLNVIDIVHNFNLNKLAVSQAEFNAWAKGFMPRRAKDLAGEPKKADKFKADARKYVTFIGQNFKDFEFYTGQSCDPEDMFIACKHNEDGTVPYFYLLEAAVDNMKC